MPMANTKTHDFHGDTKTSMPTNRAKAHEGRARMGGRRHAGGQHRYPQPERKEGGGAPTVALCFIGRQLSAAHFGVGDDARGRPTTTAFLDCGPKGASKTHHRAGLIGCDSPKIWQRWFPGGRDPWDGVWFLLPSAGSGSSGSPERGTPFGPLWRQGEPGWVGAGGHIWITATPLNPTVMWGRVGGPHYPRPPRGG
ncbi:MAG: hypothetical protein CM15mP103_02700 [Gammaproteobacteria bacterium]|nr:MAG: hypothetical protein CM15mP103_02700 [Gammaproteobacteria bacterium]